MAFGFKKKKKELKVEIDTSIPEKRITQLTPEQQALISKDISPESKEALRRQQPTFQQVQPKGMLRKVAEFGLTPAAFAARQINKLIGRRLTAGKKVTTAQIAEATAETPVGFGLGLITVGAETAVGGRAALRFLPGLKGAAAKVMGKKEGLIGRWIPENVVQQMGRRAGLSPNAIEQVKFQLGAMRVNEVAQSLVRNQGSLMRNILIGKTTKGLAARATTAILVGWFGADTIAQSVSIQANTLQSHVIFGQLTPAEAQAKLNSFKIYNNIGKTSLLAAASISPATLPILALFYASTKLADENIDTTRRIVSNYL